MPKLRQLSIEQAAISAFSTLLFTALAVQIFLRITS